jgi:hypothetical protein
MESTDLIAVAAALVPHKDALKEVYSDLLKPGVVQAGKAIGDSLEGMFLPITEWKEKRKLLFQKRMEVFSRWLEKVPDEKILPVPPDLGVPILEKLSYVEDEVISQLFLSLLTTAANEDTVNMAHPSFIRVIESLSADEAKLLLEFKEKGWVIGAQEIRENTQTGDKKLYGKRHGRLENTPNLRFRENIEVYLSNFVGLGIIERSGRQLLPEEYEEEAFYEDRHQVFDELQKEIIRDPLPLKGNAHGLGEYRIFLTAYGRMFLSACVKNVEVRF